METFSKDFKLYIATFFQEYLASFVGLMSLCVPSSCSKDELKIILDQRLEPFDVQVRIRSLTYKGKEIEIETTDIIFM